MEKTVILLNPSAGQGRGLRFRGRLEALLKREGVTCELVVTRSEEDLRSRARELAGKVPVIVGAGGDSTFHILVNEIRGRGADTRLGMIPVGSSNDICREFGWATPEAAVRALGRGSSRAVDLGVIHAGGREWVFPGQANVGLGVSVNRFVASRLGRRKRGGNQFLTGMRGIRAAVRSGELPLELTIESGKGTFTGHLDAAVFSNIRYWATGLKICPGARSDDGLLDACLVGGRSFSGLIRVAFRARKGRHTELAGVQMLRSPFFKITAEKPFAVQSDGEILGDAGVPALFDRIEIRVLPGALLIVSEK